MRVIGFSTGAIAKSDFLSALDILRRYRVSAVELSALRLSELYPLVKALPSMELSDFEVISFHGPSRFDRSEESLVISYLMEVIALEIPIVIHPDVIYSFDHWAWFGDWLLIENMDKRKPVGRTADELSAFFERLPEARLCFDIGHARQVDPTMAEAKRILMKHGGRLAQVHLSEVNSSSKHDPLSAYAIEAFQSVANLIPEHVPVILETLIDQGQSDIPTELDHAIQALRSNAATVLTSV